MGDRMIIRTSSQESLLRCADRGCPQRETCLRFIDIDRQSTPYSVAGSLREYAHDQSIGAPCPWYLDPTAEDASAVGRP
jgi:hypothetical protein